MNEIEKIAALNALAARANRPGDPPEFDVADRVLADIRARRRSGPTDRRVWQATALATGALAIIAAVWAAQACSTLTNPLSDLGDAPSSMEMR